MSNTMQALKYLFVVEYLDGTTYEQNEEDISISDDKTKSCFFDVKLDKVRSFSLVGDGNIYSVDLEDGHFEINGISFFIHQESLKDFRLIFFRKHRHTFTQNREELSHDITYRFGWQTNDSQNKNIQKIIEIK